MNSTVRAHASSTSPRQISDFCFMQRPMWRAFSARFIGQALSAGTSISVDRVGTVHDMRVVFLDNDTKLLFCTAYDGDWDPYIDDFGTKIPDILDLQFAHEPTQFALDGNFTKYSAPLQPGAIIRSRFRGPHCLGSGEHALSRRTTSCRS